MSAFGNAFPKTVERFPLFCAGNHNHLFIPVAPLWPALLLVVSESFYGIALCLHCGVCVANCLVNAAMTEDLGYRERVYARFTHSG